MKSTQQITSEILAIKHIIHSHKTWADEVFEEDIKRQVEEDNGWVTVSKKSKRRR